MGHQPIHLDSDKQVDGMLFGIEHFCHKDHVECMDPSIDSRCMLYYQGNQCLFDILLFELKKLGSVEIV